MTRQLHRGLAFTITAAASFAVLVALALGLGAAAAMDIARRAHEVQL